MSERSLLGFAASEENPDDVLVVSRGEALQRRRRGTGAEHLLRHHGPSGAMHYGRVDEVEWPERNRVRLSLSREAMQPPVLLAG